MRTVAMPELSYSVWYTWEERNTIPEWSSPGVYLIAISDKSLAERNPEYTDVCYIGMTHSQHGLKERWGFFDREIRRTPADQDKKSVHSGGRSARKALGHYNEWSQQLFVSCVTVACNTTDPGSEDYLKMGQVRFLEYEAFSEYYKAMPHVGKPQYNTR